MHSGKEDYTNFINIFFTKIICLFVCSSAALESGENLPSIFAQLQLPMPSDAALAGSSGVEVFLAALAAKAKAKKDSGASK